MQPEDTIRFIMCIRMLMRHERDALNEVRGRAIARDRGGKWMRKERRKGEEETIRKQGGRKQTGNNTSWEAHSQRSASYQSK